MLSGTWEQANFWVIQSFQTEHGFVEHIVAIIASLVRNCGGTQKQRLLNKFAESDHEKVLILDVISSF